MGSGNEVRANNMTCKGALARVNHFHVRLENAGDNQSFLDFSASVAHSSELIEIHEPGRPTDPTAWLAGWLAGVRGRKLLGFPKCCMVSWSSPTPVVTWQFHSPLEHQHQHSPFLDLPFFSITSCSAPGVFLWSSVFDIVLARSCRPRSTAGSVLLIDLHNAGRN